MLGADAICSPELLMRCLADCLGGVRAGANGQRGHLRHHPGILRGLWLQRWLQLAAVVKEWGEERRGEEGEGWVEPLVGPVFTGVTTTTITVLLFGSCRYLYDERPSIDWHQTSAILFVFCLFLLLPASCWNDSSMDGKYWLTLKLDFRRFSQFFCSFICKSSPVCRASSVPWSCLQYDKCNTNQQQCRRVQLNV